MQMIFGRITSCIRGSASFAGSGSACRPPPPRLHRVSDRYSEWLNEHADEEPPLTPAERVQLAEAQRELRELRMENEFLKKVIMPAGAGTGDRMRIGAAVRS
jgi:hypothetical protein